MGNLKKLLIGSMIVLLLAPVGAGAAGKEPDKLIFGMNWIWNGSHGYFIPALKLGYYREANLEVDLKRGYGSGDAIKRVAAGQADIAFTDLSALVVARSQEMKVKAVAVINTLAPHCIIARRDRGIQVLKDLEGKTFGGTKVEAIVIVLPTLCELAGVDFQKIKLVSVDSESKDPLLFAGKLDAIGQFAAGGGSRWKRLAKEANIELAFFPFFNYGFKAYGLSLVASDKMIAEKPDVLKRFLEATMKGVAWALDNKEKTVKMFMEFRPEMDEEGIKDTFYDSRNLMLPGMHPNGLGWMEKEKVKYTVDVIVKTQGLKPVAVEETYTNDLLPRIKPASN